MTYPLGPFPEGKGEKTKNLFFAALGRDGVGEWVNGIENGWQKLLLLHPGMR